MDYKSASLYDTNIEYSSVSGTWPYKYQSYTSTVSYEGVEQHKPFCYTPPYIFNEPLSSPVRPDILDFEE
jgi:hypothetical protein